MFVDADVPEILIGLLFKYKREVFRNLLVIVIEKSFVAALAVEQLGQHEPMVLNLHEVLVVGSD